MMGYGPCYGWDGVPGGGWMGVGRLGLLLVGAVVVVGIVLAVCPRGGSSSNPAEILRARFARGEISAEEGEQRMRALGA